MTRVAIGRRAFLGSAGAAAALAMFPSSRLAAAPAELPKIPIPPPIGSAERLARIAKARGLMKQHSIGAMIVEPGASLDYFTGVQWWRSERLTAAIIPADGEPIIVTPFFERPSVAESLSIPAEIRTWNEDEEPLKLVADFLNERGVAGQPVGFEETDRYFILDRLKQQLPAVKTVSANPIVRGCRMIKSPAEIDLMQAAADIMLASLRYAGERTREGMTPEAIDALIASAQKTLGASYDGGLVLLGFAELDQGEIVLERLVDALQGAELVVERVAFAHGALGALRVVPEFGALGLFIQLGETLLRGIDVKDASSAAAPTA